MANHDRPTFYDSFKHIEYPPILLDHKESKDQPWYNDSDAGGFICNRGGEYKGHRLRDLPTSFIEMEAKSAHPSTYSYVC